MPAPDGAEHEIAGMRRDAAASGVAAAPAAPEASSTRPQPYELSYSDRERIRNLEIDAGRAGLARRGRCVLGDKTILDALEPAVQALLAGAASGLPPDEAFVRAARAARAGVRATIPMVARRGLALRLGERSRGHRDPGATSCFLLIRSMLDGRRGWRPSRRAH